MLMKGPWCSASSHEPDGIRSAAARLRRVGAGVGADCMGCRRCAPAARSGRKFDRVGPLAATFTCRSKGYAGGLIPAEPRCEAGFGNEEVRCEGGWVRRVTDTPKRKFSITVLLPHAQRRGAPGAKFRFLDCLYPHLMTLKAERDSSWSRRQHRAPGNRPEELEEQPEDSGFLPESVLDDPVAKARRLGRRVPHAEPETRAVHVVSNRARPGQECGCGWTTTCTLALPSKQSASRSTWTALLGPCAGDHRLRPQL